MAEHSEAESTGQPSSLPHEEIKTSPPSTNPMEGPNSIVGCRKPKDARAIGCSQSKDARTNEHAPRSNEGSPYQAFPHTANAGVRTPSMS